MTLLESWNNSTWKERIRFLMALARKEPEILRMILERVKNHA
jgi:hypothetical protein